MDDLALRLAALDPQASAAVRVIGHFDALVAARAGLQSIVRGAATLAGCPARLDDPARRLTVRVLADGVATSPVTVPDPAWPCAPLDDDAAVLWLETTAPLGTVPAVVLERAASAARTVLERTRSRRRDDPASVELLLDAGAAEADRLAAARRLGLPARVRAIALAAGRSLVVPAHGSAPAGCRAGVGPSGPVLDLPQSWRQARLALRLTAAGTAEDPGPVVVRAEDLGALALLVEAAALHREPVPDVRALDHAAASAPWVLATLDAVSRTVSLRDAARALQLHHSTLQDRLGHAESLLGWDVHEPAGRLRLQLALALRRALRAGD